MGVVISPSRTSPSAGRTCLLRCTRYTRSVPGERRSSLTAPDSRSSHIAAATEKRCIDVSSRLWDVVACSLSLARPEDAHPAGAYEQPEDDQQYDAHEHLAASSDTMPAITSTAAMMNKMVDIDFLSYGLNVDLQATPAAVPGATNGDRLRALACSLD